MLRQFVSVGREQLPQNLDLVRGSFVSKAKEDYSVVLAAFSIDEFAEIFVIGY